MKDTKKYYFTFGTGHVHKIADFVYDGNVVACVNAIGEGHARNIMFKNFGPEWAFSYGTNPPDMSFFPRGIKEVNPL